MTEEELSNIPLYSVIHLSTEHEHCTTYASEDNKIRMCVHVPYKDGVPYGRSYTHYMLNGKVYKSKKKFLEALKNY